MTVFPEEQNDQTSVTAFARAARERSPLPLPETLSARDRALMERAGLQVQGDMAAWGSSPETLVSGTEIGLMAVDAGSPGRALITHDELENWVKTERGGQFPEFLGFITCSVRRIGPGARWNLPEADGTELWTIRTGFRVTGTAGHQDRSVWRWDGHRLTEVKEERSRAQS